MINCAHPVQEPGTKQCGAFEPNASCKSRGDLEAMEMLDHGDAVEQSNDSRVLQSKLPHINVLDGCCRSMPSTAVMGVVPLGQPLGNLDSRTDGERVC
jgi:hypothetical protein